MPSKATVGILRQILAPGAVGRPQTAQALKKLLCGEVQATGADTEAQLRTPKLGGAALQEPSPLFEAQARFGQV